MSQSIGKYANKKTVIEASYFFEGADREFFRRVWASPLDTYRERIESLGFHGFDRVLDAGCGMGQWSLCLAEKNRHVTGIDYSSSRVKACRFIARGHGLNNIDYSRASVEKMRFASKSFDAIFCYGVVFLTDFRKTLREFFRVLKPGGKLYLSANGVGWFGFLIAEEHNRTRHYNPRLVALKSIEESLLYFSNQKKKGPSQLVIPSSLMREELKSTGFTKVKIGADGSLGPRRRQSASFYRQNYEGIEFVYEALCQKPR